MARLDGILRSTILALCVIGAIAFWIWSEGAERRALRDLPEAEREAVYRRTLENYGAVCASGDLALDEYCRGQAQILLAFPECDEACRALAGHTLGRRGP
jgi:hypothetical protein